MAGAPVTCRTAGTRLLPGLIALGLLMGAPRAVALDGLATQSGATIQHLLHVVADSDFEFVRNGKSYTAAEAADHMLRKYEHFADRIASPEDFIEWAATRSLVSGRVYTVRTADGEVPTAEWLTRALAEYRNNGSAVSGALR